MAGLAGSRSRYRPMTGHGSLQGPVGPGWLDAPGVPAAAEDSPRLRFRRYLTDHVGDVAETAWYFEQAVPLFGVDAEARLVVEELLDHLARLMSFDVRHEDAAALSVWSSPSGPQLVVSAMDPTEGVASLRRLAGGLDELRMDGRLRSDRPSTTLAVICGEVRHRPLEQAVEFRRVSEPVRLVGLEALLALARALEAGVVSPAVAVALLQPPSAFADPLIMLLSGTAD